MKKIYTIAIVSFLVIASLGISIYQYIATTKADLANAASTKPANGHSWAEMESDADSIQVSGQKITNLSLPTGDTDAASKAYVDAASGGGTWTSCYTLYSTSNDVLCATGYTSLFHYYGTTSSWVLDNADGMTNAQGYLFTIGGDSHLVRYGWCYNTWDGPTCLASFQAKPTTPWALANSHPNIFIDNIALSSQILASANQTYGFCCK